MNTSIDTPLFRESQSLRRWLLWLPFLALTLLFVWGIIRQEVFHTPFGDKPAPSIILAVLALFMGILAYLFLAAQLDVEIHNDSIRYRYFPFVPSWRTVRAVDVQSAYVRTYHPILEYGGWGYRAMPGFMGKGKALNISGNQGIQLVFTDGARLLLGTRRPADAKQALEKSSGLSPLVKPDA
jgi:uncharacterized integral membrane protein